MGTGVPATRRSAGYSECILSTRQVLKATGPSRSPTGAASGCRWDHAPHSAVPILASPFQPRGQGSLGGLPMRGDAEARTGDGPHVRRRARRCARSRSSRTPPRRRSSRTPSGTFCVVMAASRRAFSTAERLDALISERHASHLGIAPPWDALPNLAAVPPSASRVAEGDPCAAPRAGRPTCVRSAGAARSPPGPGHPPRACGSHRP